MDAATLMDSQRELQVRISRAVEYLKKMGAPNITSSAVATRTRLLDQTWQKFEAQHDLLRAVLKDKFKDSDYVTSGVYDLAEGAYVAQRSELDKYATRLRTDAETARVNDAAPRTSLPRIKIPQFVGIYAEWPTFRDLYQSVIGENAAISNVERFHYLRLSVQGQAEKLICSLPVTGENYERAWSILCKHYDNKRELIRFNFAAFTAVPKMKGETADELSRIHNAITTAVNAQESIGRPINSTGMDLFNHLAVELFDARTRLEWETATSESVEPPKHQALLDFISRRVLTLNAAKPKAITKSCGESLRTAKSHVAKHGSDTPQCAFCHERHRLMTCGEFKAKSAVDRKAFVETNRLCYNCLGNHYLSKCQSKKTCFICKARHHTTLHDACTTSTPRAPEATTLAVLHKTGDRKAVLLATARVNIADRHGAPHDVRALIDQGSKVSIVSETLAQQLRLPRSHSDMTIFGLGGTRPGTTRGKVTLHITSDVTGIQLSVVAFVLPRLSLQQSSAPSSRNKWPHIQGIQLVDPRFYDNDPAELLLGAEVCSLIFEEGLRKGGPQMPIAQKTSLGWILSGAPAAQQPAITAARTSAPLNTS